MKNVDDYFVVVCNFWAQSRRIITFSCNWSLFYVDSCLVIWFWHRNISWFNFWWFLRNVLNSFKFLLMATNWESSRNIQSNRNSRFFIKNFWMKLMIMGLSIFVEYCKKEGFSYSTFKSFIWNLLKIVRNHFQIALYQF